MIPLRYLDDRSRPRLRKIPKKVVKYPVSMYLTKGSPYLGRINSVILRLIEAGIVKKWWRDIKFSKVNYKLTKFLRSLSRHDDGLHLEHLFGVFAVYLVMISVCMTVFITEVFWHYLQQIKCKCQIRLRN